MAERRLTKGVNIAAGDDMSRMFYEAARQTWGNRPGAVYEAVSTFSGFRMIDGAIFKGIVDRIGFNMGFDGIGTKVEIAERLNEHRGSATDLFAMAFDDAPVRGAEVIAAGTVLDVREIDPNNPVIMSGMHQLAEGMVKPARVGKVVIMNGEIAELGYRINGYGDFNYNWAAGVWWAASKERLLDGSQIKAGDSLIGLVEPGFRSNGITDVRKAMLAEYGNDWHNQIERSLGSVSLGKLIQTPATIYAGFINELTGGYDPNKEPKVEVHGVAHITGGGQPSKLGRMLEPTGLGLVIDNPIDPPEMMLHVQRLSGLTDKKAYGKWHMGPGMVIVTPEPARVLEQLNAYNQEHGDDQLIEGQDIGHVTDEPVIRIRNRRAVQDEEWLEFKVAA